MFLLWNVFCDSDYFDLTIGFWDSSWIYTEIVCLKHPAKKDTIRFGCIVVSRPLHLIGLDSYIPSGNWSMFEIRKIRTEIAWSEFDPSLILTLDHWTFIGRRVYMYNISVTHWCCHRTRLYIAVKTSGVLLSETGYTLLGEPNNFMLQK